MYPLPEVSISAVKKPLLILMTETFEKELGLQGKNQNENAIKIGTANKEAKLKTLTAELSGSMHVNIADTPIYMPREATFMKLLGPLDDHPSLFQNLRSMINSFLELIVLDGDKNTVETVLQIYKDKEHDEKFAFKFH